MDSHGRYWWRQTRLGSGSTEDKTFLLSKSFKLICYLNKTGFFSENKEYITIIKFYDD